ncbi:PEPxxWA-CTERM sorting domain-containing protein [Phenylobacterium sp. Root700]|uniref:PEPxxWA-CTERM sorting domain-containing protein n=1 Tax=Phenylobacterium sp. Root700 TaxID=1736591 RepID=UPI00070174F6|nr:PEPxxWA-CTERM sorting domain-containing protein [Phenylobacterium sp. Root700]KRB48918.1 hypothetical protein ASE02_01075 [Phenylobacterium sp. Root700]
MKNLLVTVALAATALTAVPATAAQILYLSGSNYAEAVHNDGQAAGNSITLKTQPGGYLVDYTANAGAALTPNGNGFGKQNGPFSLVTVDPLTVGFSKMGFTLTPGGKNNLNYKFDVLVNFVGGGSQLLSGLLPSNGKVDIWADTGEVFDSLTIQNLQGRAKSKDSWAPYNFSDIRHTSFDAVALMTAVPEPATWAMMIIGFGAVGSMVRRRGRTQAFA